MIVSVCPSACVCLSVHDHISGTLPNFLRMSPVAAARSSGGVVIC